MRAIGSSFLARLRVARDFENTELTNVFLTSRGLSRDVDSLNQSVLRIKLSVQELISDAFYSTFAVDVAAELENRLIGLANEEMSLLKDTPEIRTYISFHLNPEYTNLTVTIIYQYGAQSREFNIFSKVEDLSDSDVESTISKRPALYWLVDSRSPLFSIDALNNLKIYLLIERLLHKEIPREDKTAIRFHAKEIVKKENLASVALPEELNEAYKTIVYLVKQFANKVVPTISVSRHYTSLENGKMEHQILLIVTGAESFTCGLGTISSRKSNDINIDKMAMGFKTGVQDSRWIDLFDGDFIKDNLSPDDVRLRYIVYLFKYRLPHRRSEKLMIDLIPNFPHFTAELNGEDILLNMSYSTELEISKNNFRVGHAFWLYKKSILRLKTFCAEKDIAVIGNFTFESTEDGTDQKNILQWDMTGDKDIVLYKFKNGGKMKIKTVLEMGISRKSNVKLVKLIGKTAVSVVHAPDIAKACK